MPRQRKPRNPKTDIRTSAVLFTRVPLTVEARMDALATKLKMSRSALLRNILLSGLQPLEAQLARDEG